MAGLYQSILSIFITVSFVTGLFVIITRKMPGSKTGGFMLLVSSGWSTAYAHQLTQVFSEDLILGFMLKQVSSFLLPSVYLVYIIKFFEFKVPRWLQGSLFIIPASFSTFFMLPEYRSMFFQELIIYNQVHVAPKYTILGLVPIFYNYILSIILLAYFIKTMVSQQTVLKIRVITFLIATTLFDLSYTLDLFNIYPLGFEMTPPLVNLMGVAVAMITSERLYKRDALSSIFESMVEEIGDLVIATDNMDRVIFLNSGASSITKLENHGFLTHYIWDFFPSLTIDSGDRVQKLAADGRTYDVQSSYLQDWQHHNRSKLYVLRDVTELIDYQNNLEELVEIKSKELMQTERMAAIGETTLMVGHDLRNPLQVLKFLTHQVKKMNESGETEAIASLLEKMDSNVNYMDKIVSDLSLYARNRQPTKQPVVLIDLLENCLVKINVPNDVFIDYDFEFKHQVYCDPYMIERVFNNLILNSVQAMPDGGVVRVHAQKQDGLDVITITDSGVGIPEEIKANMFEPLNTSKPKGVGMGLAVCKKIVNLHEGSITVDTTVDEGASFVIKMPDL